MRETIWLSDQDTNCSQIKQETDSLKDRYNLDIDMKQWE